MQDTTGSRAREGIGIELLGQKQVRRAGDSARGS